MANANVQTITLAELELLASDVDDVCSGIVHAILFQRVIGLYRPLEGHMQSLDISFVSTRHPHCIPFPHGFRISEKNNDSLNSTTIRFASPLPSKWRASRRG